MLLQNFKRIYKQDYKADFQDLVEQLSLTINNGFEALYNALRGNLSLKDNISCTLKSVQLSVNKDGSLKNPVTIALKNTNKVQGLTILKIDNLSNLTSYTSSGVNISFTVTDNGVRFDNIKGLNTDDKYQINVVIFQD